MTHQQQLDEVKAAIAAIQQEIKAANEERKVAEEQLQKAIVDKDPADIRADLNALLQSASAELTRLGQKEAMLMERENWLLRQTPARIETRSGPKMFARFPSKSPATMEVPADVGLDYGMIKSWAFEKFTNHTKSVDDLLFEDDVKDVSFTELDVTASSVIKHLMRSSQELGMSTTIPDRPATYDDLYLWLCEFMTKPRVLALDEIQVCPKFLKWLIAAWDYVTTSNHADRARHLPSILINEIRFHLIFDPLNAQETVQLMKTYFPNISLMDLIFCWSVCGGNPRNLKSVCTLCFDSSGKLIAEKVLNWLDACYREVRGSINSMELSVLEKLARKRSAGGSYRIDDTEIVHNLMRRGYLTPVFERLGDGGNERMMVTDPHMLAVLTLPQDRKRAQDELSNLAGLGMESFITSLLGIMSNIPGFEFMGMPMEGKIPRSLYFISHDVDFVLYNCYSGDDYHTLVIGNSKLSFREWCECDFVSFFDTNAMNVIRPIQDDIRKIVIAHVLRAGRHMITEIGILMLSHRQVLWGVDRMIESLPIGLNVGKDDQGWPIVQRLTFEERVVQYKGMNVLVVAGQPGVGKSYFMRDMLLDMSFCQDQPRKYINLMVEDQSL
ncbi:hypothetical protein MP638_006531 [Amoeboaphelidium occidentale]|nr:hypothetical protein MP638_006531 [Amoeboaphelidium occidentale]